MSRRSSDFKDYIVFHFYLPDYGIQGESLPIPLSYFEKYGWKRTLMHARDIFLERGLQPSGEIHNSHLTLWERGEITFSARLRRMSSKIAKKLRMKAGKPLPRRG